MKDVDRDDRDRDDRDRRENGANGDDRKRMESPPHPSDNDAVLTVGSPALDSPPPRDEDLDVAE